MPRLLVFMLAVCLSATGCRPSEQPTQPEQAGAPGTGHNASSAGDQEAELGGLVIGEPLRHANLTIFPVSSKVPRNEDLYITLDEGLKAGTVEVFEVGAINARTTGEDREQPGMEEAVADEPALPPAQQASDDPFTQEVGGDVNRLMVVNRSGRLLYLMPGEIIYGGKQDRCIGCEYLIVSGEEPVPIEVYCVEQGRWAGRMLDQSAGELQALAYQAGRPLEEEEARRLAAEANRGKFVASAGNLSKASRLAVQTGDGQGQVWQEVATANAAAEIQGDTGAFTANYADQDVAKELQTYADKLERPIAETRQVVGVVMAVNGKVEAMDVFGSTPLFKKLWPKLLRSYALDAANVADDEEADKRSTRKDARGFLASALEGEEQSKTEVDGGLVVSRRSSGRVVGFGAGFAAEDASGGMGGGFGGVHYSAFSE